MDVMGYGTYESEDGSNIRGDRTGVTNQNRDTSWDISRMYNQQYLPGVQHHCDSHVSVGF